MLVRGKLQKIAHSSGVSCRPIMGPFRSILVVKSGNVRSGAIEIYIPRFWMPNIKCNSIILGDKHILFANYVDDA